MMPKTVSSPLPWLHRMLLVWGALAALVLWAPSALAQTVAAGQTEFSSPHTYFTTDTNSCTTCHAPTPEGGRLAYANDWVSLKSLIQDSFVNNTNPMYLVYDAVPSDTAIQSLALYFGNYVAPNPPSVTLVTPYNTTRSADLYPGLPAVSGVATDATVTNFFVTAGSGAGTVARGTTNSTGPQYGISFNPNSVVGTTTATYSIKNTTGTVAANITGYGVGVTNATLTKSIAEGSSSANHYQITSNCSTACTVNSYSAVFSPSTPSGLSFSTATGIISGNPAAGSAGTYTVTLGVRMTSNDGYSGAASNTLVANKTLTLTVVGVTSAASASTNTGATFDVTTPLYAITTNGTTSGTNPYSVSGTLPTGITLDTASGKFIGTVDALANGSYPVTVSVVTTAGTVSKAVTFTVGLSDPVITSAATATGTTGQAFSYQITSLPTATSYGLTGTLPNGLSVDSNGLISGTPTESGVFNVTLMVDLTSNGVTKSDTQALAITIALGSPGISSSLTASGSTGTAFNYTLTATNPSEYPVVFGASGLPPGVTLQSTSTGVISGTPTTEGSYNSTITATITNPGTMETQTDTETLVITIALTAPTITSATTDSGATGVAYSYQITSNAASINPSAYPVSYNATGLPPGLSVDTGTGLISGTPTANGSYSVALSATITSPSTTATGTATLALGIDFTALVVTDAALSTPVNTTLSSDFSTLGVLPAVGVTGLSAITQPAHGSATFSGTTLTYTPAAGFFGTDSFTYQALGVDTTTSVPPVSNVATVTITVTGRPDPTADSNVTELLATQIETAKTFSRAQVSNFMGRLEALHRRNAARTPEAGESSAGLQQGRATAVKPDSMASAARLDFSATDPDDTASGGPAGRASPQGTLAGRGGAYAPASTGGGVGDGPAARVADDATAATAALVSALNASAQQSDSGTVRALGQALGLAYQVQQTGALQFDPANSADAGMAPLAGAEVWVGGSLRFSKAATPGRSGFSSEGLSVGIDKPFGDKLIAGVGLGFGRDKVEIGTDGTQTEGDGRTLALYGSYQPSADTFVDGLLGYGRLDYDNRRFVAPISAIATSQRGGSMLFGSLAVGYDWRQPGLSLSPYVRADIARYKLDAATESGAGLFNLAYAAESFQSRQLSVGLRAETQHQADFGWVLPRVRMEIQHDFDGDGQANLSYADLPGTVYTVTTPGAERNSIILGLGADFLFGKGLSLSVDYELQYASRQTNSQGIYFKLNKALDGQGLDFAGLQDFTMPSMVRGLRVDYSVNHDSNVGRAHLAADTLSDTLFNLHLSRAWRIPATENTRWLINGYGGADRWKTYRGLDRLYAGALAEWQYRASGDFLEPTWGLTGELQGESYTSAMRDGVRLTLGGNVRMPITDKVFGFAALTHEMREASNAVFDSRTTALRGNLDYVLSTGSTLYLGAEWRVGDQVSSGRPSLTNVNLAEVFAADDAFAPNAFSSYRFDGQALLLTLGYNLPLGDKYALDFSWRHVRAKPSLGLAGSPVRYRVNQLNIVFLQSF